MVVNLHHLPETVTGALGSGRRFGLRIRYSEEPVLLGTGGGPRAVAGALRRRAAARRERRRALRLRPAEARGRAPRLGGPGDPRPADEPRPRAYSPVVTDRPAGSSRSPACRGAARGPVSMFASVHVLDPALLDRLPEGASDSVRDLYIPLLAEGAHAAGGAHAGCVVRFRPPLALPRRAAAPAAGPRARPCPRGREGAGGRHRARCGAPWSGAARVGAGARVERSVLWDGAVVEAGARVAGAIVATGGVVRAGERAEDVIVLPAAALAGREAGGRVGATGGHGVVELAVTGRTAGEPLDAAGALALIRRYLEDRRPEDAATVRVVPLSGDASTRRYFRLVDGGRSHVLALYPEPFVPEELTYLSVHGLLESLRASRARHRGRRRVAGRRAPGGPRRPHAAGGPRGRAGPAGRALPRGGRPARAAPARGGAGPAEGRVLPHRLRHREAVVGAALLPEALPGGPPRRPTSRSRTGRPCPRRSTS